MTMLRPPSFPGYLKHPFSGVAVLDFIRNDFNNPVMELGQKILSGYFVHTLYCVHLPERFTEPVRVIPHAVHSGSTPGLQALIAEKIFLSVIGLCDGKAYCLILMPAFLKIG